MSVAPEIPYTDRDVREDPTLIHWAVEYLSKYGGSFEPLVNAQQLLGSGKDLPTNIVRVVLNCMRHDVHVATLLPKPQPRFQIVRGVKKEVREENCAQTSPHRLHWATPTMRCPGIPWPITRGNVNTPASVKKPYARAKTGKLWHYVNPGRGESYVHYFGAPMHEFGVHKYADLYVKTMCKYPSYLKNPILMDNRPSLELLQQLEIEECPHCIAVMSCPPELRP